MKLLGLTWFIVGLSVAIVAIGFAAFQYYIPNTTLTGYYKEQSEAYDRENAKNRKAQQRRETAIAMVAERAAKWKETVAWRTPATNVNDGGINVGVNGWQLTVDSQRFRNSIQRAVNAQVRRGGVIVESGPLIPDPGLNATGILASFYNYPAMPYPIVMFDLGAVTVRGTYSQITANVRSWATMPDYLAVTDGLQVTGTSPNLVGTYNLSIVGYIRGDKILPAVPEGAAAAPAGAPGAPNQPARPRNPNQKIKGGV